MTWSSTPSAASSKKVGPASAEPVATAPAAQTPWNSWLTCEESVYGPGDREEGGTPPPKPAAKVIAVKSGDNSLTSGSKPEVKKPKKVKPIKIMGFTKTHGWVFDVPAEGTAAPRPIIDMGRFVHEAVAVDPTTGAVYETEDRDNAGFYRYTPRRPRDLHAGGELEMLRVSGKDSLGRGIKVGESFSVDWVTIDDPTVAHTPGTRNNLGVFTQGKQKGGATFLRLEGCCYHQGRVYITSTNGGEAGAGRVWEYDPARDQLRLLFESPSFEVLDMPDNLTVSPRGGIVLCEDGKLPLSVCTVSPHKASYSPSPKTTFISPAKRTASKGTSANTNGRPHSAPMANGSLLTSACPV